MTSKNIEPYNPSTDPFVQFERELSGLRKSLSETQAEFDLVGDDDELISDLSKRCAVLRHKIRLTAGQRTTLKNQMKSL